MGYKINNNCIGCGSCAKKCPENAIEGKIKARFEIDEFMCVECGNCFNTCKMGAITDPLGNTSPKKGKKQNESKSHIDPELCAGCKNCYLNCPMDAITIVKKGFLGGTYCRINPDLCSGCGTCIKNCITGAAIIE
ncbi:MAG: 4Fe-4S binding protein [Desulfamplus sp.]|nr:4Fe-4S binding protein [Desulfamplus sp.]MBF0388574.1 4Fe-4S binding protein [Desulfamplus sp.]